MAPHQILKTRKCKTIPFNITTRGEIWAARAVKMTIAGSVLNRMGQAGTHSEVPSFGLPITPEQGVQEAILFKVDSQWGPLHH